MADSSDGLLDLLCNVVGILVLVSSMCGVFAAVSAVNIQTPMSTKTERNYWMLQANKDGIWDIQPIVERMAELDRERANNEEILSQDGWSQVEDINGIKMTLNHSKGSIMRSEKPTVKTVDLNKKSNKWIETLMKKLAEEEKAIFIVLEKDGFANYRLIKRQAMLHKVPVGWEPWYTGDPINFWGNAGRSMTVQ